MINELTREECEHQIKLLDKKFNVNNSIIGDDNKLIMNINLFDQVVNELLDLEQRLEDITRVETTEKMLSTRSRDELGIMTPKGMAPNIDAAAELMGYKRQTILQYLVNAPDRYYRVYEENLDE